MGGKLPGSLTAEPISAKSNEEIHVTVDPSDPETFEDDDAAESSEETSESDKAEQDAASEAAQSMRAKFDNDGE